MLTDRQKEKTAYYVMTPNSVADYLQYEIDRGASTDSIRIAKRITRALFEWLPEDKTITQNRLIEWRQGLKDHGYTYHTELNYVKGVNRYLDYMGFSDIRFNRGRAKDIRGKQFGYLTAIEPTGEKNRKDYIWRCLCQCGKEVEYPATRLLTGNTVSCGCLRGAQFKEVNKYIAGTSLRQSIEEQVHSTRARSGYTGVTIKRGKWLAYEEFHKDDYKPDRSALPKVENEPLIVPGERVIRPTVARSNNTSGYPGVAKARKKWRASISYQGERYVLGYFSEIEDAIAARMDAEKRLNEDPQAFVMEQGRKKELCV